MSPPSQYYHDYHTQKNIIQSLQKSKKYKYKQDFWPTTYILHLQEEQNIAQSDRWLIDVQWKDISDQTVSPGKSDRQNDIEDIKNYVQ